MQCIAHSQEYPRPGPAHSPQIQTHLLGHTQEPDPLLKEYELRELEEVDGWLTEELEDGPAEELWDCEEELEDRDELLEELLEELEEEIELPGGGGGGGLELDDELEEGLELDDDWRLELEGELEEELELEGELEEELELDDELEERLELDDELEEELELDDELEEELELDDELEELEDPQQQRATPNLFRLPMVRPL